jgi:response regulator NasT
MAGQPLTVCVAAPPAKADALAGAIEALGHVVRRAKLTPRTAVAALRDTDVEVVVVPRGVDGERALRLIGMLGHAGSHPVVGALPGADHDWVEKAIAAGASAIVVGHEPDDLRIALRLAWQRSRDRLAQEEAFGRRATIEQAKGLLMARYGVGSDRAFALLREHSQSSNRRLGDLASALVKAHALMGVNEAVTADAGARPPLNDRTASGTPA